MFSYHSIAPEAIAKVALDGGKINPRLHGATSMESRTGTLSLPSAAVTASVRTPKTL